MSGVQVCLFERNMRDGLEEEEEEQERVLAPVPKRGHS